MKVWVVAVVVFFGAAELYQWLQHLKLPLPVYGMAGLLLAIVSNAEHWYPPQAKLPLEPDATLVPDLLSPPEAIPRQSSADSPLPPNIAQAPSQSETGPQLPNFAPTVSPSISFTIQKRKQE